MELIEEIGTAFELEQKKASDKSSIELFNELMSYSTTLDPIPIKKMLLTWERELRHLLMKEFKPKYFARTEDLVADDRIAALFFFSRAILDMVEDKGTGSKGNHEDAVNYIAKFFAFYVKESLESHETYLQEREKILAYEKKIAQLESKLIEKGVIQAGDL